MCTSRRICKGKIVSVDIHPNRPVNLPLRPVTHTKDEAGNDSAEIHIARDGIEDGDFRDSKDRIFERRRQNDLNMDQNQTDGLRVPR